LLKLIIIFVSGNYRLAIPQKTMQRHLTIRLLAIIAILVVLPHISTGRHDLFFEKLLTTDGLPHSTVYAISQDSKGFIWIGTREGLVRYDSYEIKPFPEKKVDEHVVSLGSEHVSALASFKTSLIIATLNDLFIYDIISDQLSRLYYMARPITNIQSLYVSSNGLLYICSESGLFLADQEGNTELLIGSVRAFHILEYKSSVFWLLHREGISLINNEGETIKNYSYLYNNGKPEIPTQNNLTKIFVSKDGEIFVGTFRNGLFKYDVENDRFSKFFPAALERHLEKNMIRAINEDTFGNLWVGTEYGLYIINPTDKSYTHITRSLERKYHTLSDKAIYDIYKSKEGIMWLGTYFGGVNYSLPGYNYFHKWFPGYDEGFLGGRAVSQMLELNNGDIWFGTEDGGITVLDKNREQVSYIRYSEGPNSISTNNIHALHEDSEGTIWIGTFLGGLNRYYPETGKFLNFYHNPNNKNSLSNNMVYAVLEDSEGRLWVGTQAGLNLFIKQEQKFQRFLPDLLGDKFIYDIFEDKSNNIWFCTRGAGLYRLEPNTEDVRQFNITNTYGSIISNDFIFASQAKDGTMWFGTLEGGLVRWDVSSESFFSYTQSDGLYNKTIYGILEDDHGNLWVSSNRGLSTIHPNSFQITHYTTINGLIDNQFNFKSALKTQDGHMYFGTVNGLTFFHPDSLLGQIYVPEVFINEVRILNPKTRDIDIAFEQSSPIDNSEFRFTHRQNILHIDFGAISFRSLGKAHYLYKMEGFDDRWRYIENTRTATYTNLPPGKYHFQVKASIDKLNWSEPGTISFVISPPFWNTFPAYLVYFLLTAILLFFLQKIIRQRQRELLQLNVARIEKQKMEELNQHKMNYFTYLSHELKTPLTLILASAEKLTANSMAGITNGIDIIKLNAKKLHHLIEQLMEFRKVNSDFSALQLVEGDIIAFLKDTFYAFEPLLDLKEIEYRVVADNSPYIACFDGEKMEMILMNIISNSIKHTPVAGTIRLKIDVDKSSDPGISGKVHITVSDTGRGFGTDQAQRVLMPFYMVESDNREHITGSGIGLALVDSLVRFLHGEMFIDSEPGKGTVIIVILPLLNKADIKNEKVSQVKGNPYLKIDPDLFRDGSINEQLFSVSGSGFEMLIVDDNKDIVGFLSNHFSTNYKISHATNGNEAFEKVKRVIPDIILCDVLMPVTDGITFCKQIKSDISMSHIPVVMMTADSADERKIEAYEAGADYFIRKPFSIMELELIIKNLLTSRFALRKHFQKFGSFDFKDKKVNVRDQEFLFKLNEIIIQYMDDQEFDVSVLVRESGVSRSLLHNKLKKLMDMSATEFIKSRKIQFAKQLLRDGNSISEAAYACGFSDPSYFTKTFKVILDMTPKEYKQRYSGEGVGNEPTKNIEN
jgi:ligand-binding sensor domain-containing protein/signal transduction histidine kinase/DNA-binding response OmpR family regulator